MWAMTGHCAYSYECDRWKTGCGLCPHLDEYPRLKRDTSALLWNVKDWVYQRSRLTIVAPSNWLASLARQSPLLNRFPIHLIPNGLDLTVFRPIPKPLARERLGLGPTGRVILFSAASITLERKGGRLLQQALACLNSTEFGDVTLLVMGAEDTKWPGSTSYKTKTLGYVESDEALAIVYSAADLFVLPTLAENLPNGILESMACGTPVLSFHVGGVPDAVRHLETGYLAPLADAEELANGLKMLLRDSTLRERMGRRSREIAEAHYPLDLQTARFLSLYQDVVVRG